MPGVMPLKRDIAMFFQESVELMAIYIKRHTAKNMPLDLEVSKEIVARLRQLEWLYARVVELEKKLVADYERTQGTLKPGHNVVIVYLANIPEPSVPFARQEELRVFAEAFYQCAHRLLVILDQCANMLPGLGSVSGTGVRRVRNNLIEHANKKGGRPSYTFSLSNAAGIRLRSAAPADQPEVFVDEGLRANALELRGELEALFRNAGA
jgi:hypothetical protein